MTVTLSIKNVQDELARRLRWTIDATARCKAD